MTNINYPNGLKKAAMTLTFLASIASRTFAKDNANTNTTLETGKALEWNMSDGMPSEGFDVDDGVTSPDGIEGGGNPTVKSKASKELQETALSAIVSSNGDFHSDKLRDSLINQAVELGGQLISSNYAADEGSYSELHQKEFSKISKSKEVGVKKILFQFEEGKKFFGLFGNKQLKFDEDDPLAKPVKTAREEVKKEYINGFWEIIRKIATKRETMGMAEARKSAIEEVTLKVKEKFRKFLRTLWDYNKKTYEGNQKN